MAFIQMNLLSKSLMRTVPVNVILPVDKMLPPGAAEREEKPWQTLYLLHGIFGNYTDWVCGTRIQRYAEEHDLVVVMPSGDNAFYVDRPATNNFYGQFVGEELVELTRKMFPLSRQRKDTFIGGLSMGGYGAMRNGLKYSDTFGCIVSLSGSFRLEQLAADSTQAGLPADHMRACFGDLTQLLNSDINPKYLVKELKKAGKGLPKIYMACGSQDSLLDMNRDMAAFLEEQEADVTFEVGPGGHEWDFWDAYIKKAIDWLPVKHSGLGVNSGNIGA